MYQILSKKTLAPAIHQYEIAAPKVAKKAKAGQFIILRVDETGERIPLTIADFDREKGTITIVFAEVGYSTKKLAKLNAGDAVADFVGPLGVASHVDKFGTVVMVAGGVGVAPIYPIAREMKKMGNHVVGIMGARNKDLIFWEDRMKEVTDELLVTTDDGSYVRKGFVTDVLREYIEKEGKPDLVMAIGPLPMMKAVADLTRGYEIKTMVSLNSIMVDGTGMCGACRVTVGGETRFVCVHGPEFDGHLVDFNEQLMRSRQYKTEEQHALNRGGCGCGGGGKCHG
ncbi:oxidoreductase FAD/NAD(P)-binding domain protein [Desulfotomaculum nigrificans CO-1-SRB]|uniref:Oxidoreductase FAD/NAD(P)-binding domain protein n=1 Tax=Desulfotomaculum nigrificans (strain DSM 14880 / VKM B-2319 / CO-1-SRB) TaxID=868595 RepID=F6B9Q4_DESCC|nr:sulfide/dihydroorotate dehydrogenase-like FAD/NAD-binding protein [Desulfotomaculum nigrificans]AEF94950.1 oxidoreductase FAD/NAD(P)-binding domain protein [Desulfotomaculum nigrificans CO-1-SRB]